MRLFSAMCSLNTSLLFAVFLCAPSNSFSPKEQTRTHIQNRHTFSTMHERPASYSITGQRQVDMNQYNLPIDQIVSEWSANVVAKTRDLEEGVYLGAKNDQNLFVDTLQISFPRRSGVGLGLELQEIAGGRQDGLGITVVAGVVAGGCAEGSEIMVGDSLSSVTVVSYPSHITSTNGLVESQTLTTIRTECFSYDATVAAISTLPSIVNNEEMYLLSIKRIRRKPKVIIKLQFPSQGEPDETIELFAGENLRLGMLVRGLKLNDPMAKRFDTKSGGNCGAGGLCRTCAVSIVRGGELLNPQKINEQQMLEGNPRLRLACKAFVGYGMREGEITIQVHPNQWRN